MRSYDERAAVAPDPRDPLVTELRRAHGAAKHALLRRAVALSGAAAPRILDCGCGRGGEWTKLGQDPSMVVGAYRGVDVSRPSIAAAAQRFPALTARGPVFDAGDLGCAAPWRRAGTGYDVVAWMFSLHHLCGDGAGLEDAVDRSCAACRRPGGCVLVIVPWGERVTAHLRGGPGMDRALFSIEAVPGDAARVRFVVHGLTPDAPEPLLSARHLDAAFERRGFAVAESGALDQHATAGASEAVRQLSRLYYYAVYVSL